MTRKSGLAIGVGIAALAIVFVLATAGEKYDMPEPLEVEYLNRMKDVGTAETEFSTLATGQRQLTIRHEVIEGVSPEMILWWFHNFPTRTSRSRVRTFPGTDFGTRAITSSSSFVNVGIRTSRESLKARTL